MPTIAIDYTPAWEQTAGIGRYARELTAALALQDQTKTYRLFVAGASIPNLPPPPAANFTWKPTLLTPRWLARLWHRARLPLPVEIFTGRINLFHATDFVLPPTLPMTLKLLTVHDLSFARVPETASPRLKAYLDAVVPRSVSYADHILADSEATKRDLIDLYHTPEAKVTVLYSGVDRRYRRINDSAILEATHAKYGLSGLKYALSVGTVQPRKNYARVIEALATLRAKGHDLHYVIAGGKGWLNDELHRAIERTGMKPFLRLLGFVADEDLPALYNEARMLVMPSLYEGFGFPVLEAMACGTPVITSEISSLPEVAGEAALLVDPYDVDAIVEAMAALDDDNTLRARLTEAGFKQAARFSWERSVAQLSAIYDTMLKT